MQNKNKGKQGTPVYETDLNKLGALMAYNLRAIRHARGWSVKKLSMRSGIPECTIRRIEHTYRMTAYVSTWILLCNALGVSIDAVATPTLTFRPKTAQEKAKEKAEAKGDGAKTTGKRDWIPEDD